MLKNRKLNKTIIFLLSFLLIALMPFYWLREGIPIAYWDSPLVGLYYPDMMDDARFVWYQPASRNVGPYLPSFLPIYIFYSMLKGTGIDIAVLQATILSVIFFSALCLMYLAVLNIFPEETGKERIAFFSAIFYLLNFSTLFYFIKELTYSIYYIPFIPAFLYVISKASRTRKIHYAFLIALLFLFLSVVFFNMGFIILLIPFGVALYLINSNAHWKKKVFFILTSIILIFFLDAFFILCLIGSCREMFEEAIETFGTQEMFTAATQNSDLLSMIRMVPKSTNPSWLVKNPDWQTLYYYGPFSILSTIPVIIVFSTLLYRGKNQKTVIFLSITCIISIFIGKAGNEPLGFLTQFIICNMPFGRIIAGTHQKFQILLIPSYSILFGYGTNCLIKSLQSCAKTSFKFLCYLMRKLSKYAAYDVLLFTLLASLAFPYWMGWIVTDPIRWDNANVSSFTKIPNYYYQLENYLRKDGEVYRLASLPIATWNMPTFRWEYGYLGVDFQGNFFKRSVISHRGYVPAGDQQVILLNSFFKPPYYPEEYMSRHITNPVVGLHKMLGLLSVRYIILHRDIDPFHGNYLGISLLEPIKIEEILKSSGLKYINSFGMLDLYRVDDAYFRPYISYANTVILSNSSDVMLDLLSFKNYKIRKDTVFLIVNQTNNRERSFLEDLDLIKLSRNAISTIPKNGSSYPFHWDDLKEGSLESRYYLGWKFVIRTDGREREDTLSFLTLKECPYEFPSFSIGGWKAFDSTLIYIKTGQRPMIISSIFEGNTPISDIVGIWWETDWRGMSTKPLELPITIPPNQRVIIQINHIIHDQITLYSLDITNFTKVNEFKHSTPIITFKKINPTKYVVNVENATQPFILVFSETFHPQWKIYIEDKSINLDKVVVEHPDFNVKEAMHDWDAFTIWDVNYLFRKPILDETYHFIANGYANAWYIDPKKIDKDGDGKFTITIYFLDQSLFYLGLIISFSTFIACLGYLIYELKADRSIIITLKMFITLKKVYRQNFYFP